MKALDWGWWMRSSLPGDCLGIPNIPMLKHEARKLLEHCLSSKANESTGGFVAIIEGNNLSLAFDVEDWDEKIDPTLEDAQDRAVERKD